MVSTGAILADERLITHSGAALIDYVGNEFEIGSVFLVCAGSPRYGGLRFDVGIVYDMTAKRLKILKTKLVTDKKRVFTKTTTTGSKALITKDPAILDTVAVSALIRKAESI